MTEKTVALDADERALDESAEVAAEADDELVLDDLLIEDVSIDGMCGVY